ncbi:MAG: hydroxymethylglutaryl-CoA synthase [Spirochaetota bacterium]
MRKIGIEKINLYPCSLYLDLVKLAQARNLDPQEVVSDYLIECRSINPPYEDTVTMGANAAQPILTEEDKKDIGMFIVGTEGSVDFGKPISTNIHGALGLSPNVRNYETKHACYSGVAALDTALNWLAAGTNHGKKALVISTDFSRMHLSKKEEFVMGGVAAALVLSDNPKIMEFELEKKGTWTTDVYDTFRPSARDEVGNNEVSLFSYMDALEGSFRNYLEHVGTEIDFDTYFKYCVYHTPFPGIAFQAHRTLCNLTRPRKKAEILESFQEKVVPSLYYAKRTGSTYSSSNFVGICSLLQNARDLKPGDRISFFAYGSGAIGEFYSGRLCPEAKACNVAETINASLARRKEVNVQEYEMVEKIRESCIEKPDVTPDFSILKDWYKTFYEGKGYLVLKKVKDFYRTYEWS